MKHSYRTQLCIGVLAITLLVSAALRSEGQSSGGADVLNVGLYIEPANLDPHAGSMTAILQELPNVYDPLVTIGQNNQHEPVLATSWELSDDARTYTFKLRRNVKFSDGTPFDAAAVKFNYERVMALKKAAFGGLRLVSSIEVADTHTVRMTLSRPWSPFLSFLRLFLIGSPAAVKSHEVAGDRALSWLAANSAGTGPYQIERWQRGSSLTLVKNPHYWRGWEGPHFSRVNLRVILEAETQRLMLETGQLDVAQIISIDALPALKRNPAIQVIETQYAAQMYLHFNTAAPPMNDVRVRRAMAHLWNHAAYTTLRRGLAPRADGPLPNILLGPGYSFKSSYEYDPAKAKELLKQAGLPSGSQLTFLLHKGDEQKRMIAEVVRDELAKIGVRLDIWEGTWPALFKKVADWGASRDPATAWHAQAFFKGPDVWSAPDFLYALFHSDTQVHKPGGQWNIAYYTNPDVDRLIDEANSVVDDRKMMALSRKANEIIMADVPAVPIDQMVEVAVMRRDIKGYEFAPYYKGRSLRLYQMYRAPSK